MFTRRFHTFPVLTALSDFLEPTRDGKATKTGKVDLANKRRTKSYEAQWKSERRKK